MRPAPADPTPLTEQMVFRRSFGGLLTAQSFPLTLNNETPGVYNQLELPALEGLFFCLQVLCTFILFKRFRTFLTLLPQASTHFPFSL